MTPLRCQIARIGSPLGALLVVTDPQQRLRAVEWHDHETRLHQLLRRQYPRNTMHLAELPVPPAVSRALQAYFDGEIEAVARLPVAHGGSDFQRAIWAALRAIPAGQTLSYRELATRIGRPAASRAAGLANGANPVAVVVPCHRVVGGNGALTGYAGGLPRKAWLLAHEARWARPPPAAPGGQL